MKLTQFGLEACDALNALHFFIFNAHQDVSRVSTPTSHGTASSENAQYDAIAAGLIASLGLCRAVDVYQWYNREILSFAAKRDRMTLAGFREGINLTAKDVDLLIRTDDVADVLIGKISFRDKVVRQHLHKQLGVFEDPSMQVLVEVRNCIVHALGVDRDGRVARAWTDTPQEQRQVVVINDGRVVLTVQSALSAVASVMSQVSIMDQQMANMFSLPVKDATLRSITRQWQG